MHKTESKGSKALTKPFMALLLQGSSVHTKTRREIHNDVSCEFQDLDRKNEHTAMLLKGQAERLTQLETLYKDEQVLRKKYFNQIEGEAAEGPFRTRQCVVMLRLCSDFPDSLGRLHP
jgi:hypothetical protein